LSFFGTAIDAEIVDFTFQRILCYHPGVQFTRLVNNFVYSNIAWFTVCNLFMKAAFYSEMILPLPCSLLPPQWGLWSNEVVLTIIKNAPLRNPSCYCCIMADVNEYSLINAQINLIWDLYTWFSHTNNHFCTKWLLFERAGLEKKTECFIIKIFYYFIYLIRNSNARQIKVNVEEPFDVIFEPFCSERFYKMSTIIVFPSRFAYASCLLFEAHVWNPSCALFCSVCIC